MGKLTHIAFGAPWLKYLPGNIYASLAAALRLNNSHLVRTSKSFRLALRALRQAPTSGDGDAQSACHSGATARSIHGCALLHHISGDLRRDLRLIERAMSAAHTPKTCPIAHLIPRVPYGVARSDSSLMAAGGYCPAAQFWWYLEWPPAVQARTLRHITTRRDPSLVSINSLEYSAQLITMLGCHLHDIETSTTRRDPHPIFLLECNSTAGQEWLSKGCTSSANDRALARLQASLLINQGAGYRFGRVDTKTNLIADGISRIASELALPHKFPLLLAQAPSLHGCRRYRPNAALNSSIVDILLQNDCMDPLSVSRQLLTHPGSFTSSPGATK